MQKIISETTLRDAIVILESRRTREENALKAELHRTYESIQPINLIKSTYHEIAASQGLKNELINTSVGLVAGYISKALFESLSHSPLKKLIGTAILFGVTSAVAKNPEAVKSLAAGAFNIIRKSATK
jgi:hypothetical protein